MTARSGTEGDERGPEPLVGIVLVSHSRLLAEGTAELVRHAGVGRVTVVPAGGDVDGGFGTSGEFVDRAVRTADAGAGAVLLADIGAAVQTARRYVTESDRNLAFVDAPFLEGAVAAATAAAYGRPLDMVADTARMAYQQRKA